jgi:cell division protein FtsL
MSRLNVLLLAILIGCALSTVNATNRERELFIELGREQADFHQMAQTLAELQYQEGALSKTSLIERVAQDQLKMEPVTPGRTQYLVINGAADAEAGAPDGASAVISELANGVASTASGATAHGASAGAASGAQR